MSGNEEDDALWQHFASTLTKLPEKPRVVPPLPAKSAVNVRQRRTEHYLPYRQESSYLSAGLSPDIDKSNAEKLKRGKYPIEARLDLHGNTQEAAYKQLSRFIVGAYGQGKRCVLVVTGKGLKEDGSKGVIRTNVPLWLNEPSLRPYILAFRHAKPADGGEGALYVLLKRQR